MFAEANIRRATLGDEAALSIIGQATFLETFAGILAGQAIVAHCGKAHSVEQYRLWLSDSHYALWLIEIEPGEAPVGFVMVSPPDLPGANPFGDLELKRIYLMSKFQGSGLGRRLIETAVSYAQAHGAERLLLGVYAENEKALSFYTRSGFEQIGTRSFNVGGVDYDDKVLAKSSTPN
ncbi:GNAT family N-acetyltransferase [Solilutibacter silvestris]|uniref:GNAT family N-acetyltransferase n=1 Tax=Solilutibacter silvestris TaxID=1645665 RepID=UPI000CA03180|nr:GNAT family N-acetyltransferase [Lysobacter silvestris]